VQTIQVGALCMETATAGLAREKCDHLANTVKALNDKRDGFFDQLLPNTKLKLVRKRVGCSEVGSVAPAISALFTELPEMRAVVGLPCSNDVQATSNWMGANNKSATIISAASTAPQLADEELYPDLARFAASEHVLTDGVIRVMLKYNWKRVGVLCDESVWATGTMAAFVGHLKVRAPSRSIPPPWRSTRFRLAPRTYAPCGPSVRVVSQTKSRKIPTRKIFPLFSVTEGLCPGLQHHQ